jgi:hypothetical protein
MGAGIGCKEGAMAKGENSEIVGDVETSWAWWLLPVLFSWLGGLIGWYCLREVAPQKGKRLLILGIALFVAAIIIAVFI